MTTVDEKLINELLKERDELLRSHPELLKYQLEIDKKLAGISDPVQRAQLLFQALMVKLREELIPAQQELQKLKLQTKELERVA